MSLSEINDALVRAGRLEFRPICVYGTDETPRGAYQVSTVITKGHRCLARALLKMAMDDNVPPIYIGRDALKGCCFGAAATLGFTPFPRSMKELMSAETKGDGSMFLKASDDVCDKTIANLGKITPPGKYVVMGPCAGADDKNNILSVLCFGTAEQDTAFIGPTEPDGNDWFPPDLMSLSMPIGLARRISEDCESSFVGKKPDITYPAVREKP